MSPPRTERDDPELGLTDDDVAKLQDILETHREKYDADQKRYECHGCNRRYLAFKDAIDCCQ